MTDQTAALLFVGIIMFIAGFIAGIHFDTPKDE